MEHAWSRLNHRLTRHSTVYLCLVSGLVSKGFRTWILTLNQRSLSHRIRSRPINPNLYENAKKEFEILTQYMYKDSTSPWASPLVIAPKATAPFIRFCGDYRWLNQQMILPQAYIPHVQHEIEKAMVFRIFLDIDMTNSFHQLVLSEETGRKLAVQTPWGLVQPRFLPEGVSPASRYL